MSKHTTDAVDNVKHIESSPAESARNKMAEEALSCPKEVSVRPGEQTLNKRIETGSQDPGEKKNPSLIDQMLKDFQLKF